MTRQQIRSPDDALWRSRLRRTVELDGRSMRSISMAAGLSENHLQQILTYRKEPTVVVLAHLAAELGVTVGYLCDQGEDQ